MTWSCDFWTFGSPTAQPLDLDGVLFFWSTHVSCFNNVEKYVPNFLQEFFLTSATSYLFLYCVVLVHRKLYCHTTEPKLRCLHVVLENFLAS